MSILTSILPVFLFLSLIILSSDHADCGSNSAVSSNNSQVGLSNDELQLNSPLFHRGSGRRDVAHCAS